MGGGFLSARGGFWWWELGAYWLKSGVVASLLGHVFCSKDREEEYVTLFVPGLRRKDPILDAYLYEDRGDGTGRDEEPDDIFEHVREDDPLRSSVAQDEHDAGLSLPTPTPCTPLRRRIPCCKHRNMLRQILEQIKKVKGQVDELKRKVDRSKEPM
ncbi:hypothetical protein Fot_06395 [Forsythia ovata]|uniref:Uncharacterized protein n=1 Tax=Forsythia ovata TaxID=205694 RepID=A0ABD1WSU6_9LAMI